MLEILEGVKDLLRLGRINTDSPVFRLHYRVTSTLLVACCLILAARQFVGSPIECVHNRDLPVDVINTWCWIHSTYTVPGSLNKVVGLEVPYPGVDNTKQVREKRVHRFYQWVAFCLLFQVSGEEHSKRHESRKVNIRLRREADYHEY